MDKLDKDLKPGKDKLSDAVIPDELLAQVTGGSSEEFRRYGRNKRNAPTVLLNPRNNELNTGLNNELNVGLNDELNVGLNIERKEFP